MDTFMLQTALLRKDQKHRWLVQKGFKQYDNKVEKVVTQSLMSSEPFNPRIRQLLEITRPKQPQKEQTRSFNINQNVDPYFEQQVTKSPSNYFRADFTANAL